MNIEFANEKNIAQKIVNKIKLVLAIFWIYCVALVNAVLMLVYADAKYTAELPNRKMVEYLRKIKALREDVFIKKTKGIKEIIFNYTRKFFPVKFYRTILIVEQKVRIVFSQ